LIISLSKKSNKKSNNNNKIINKEKINNWKDSNKP
jgi:hypothetical protein